MISSCLILGAADFLAKTSGDDEELQRIQIQLELSTHQFSIEQFSETKPQGESDSLKRPINEINKQTKKAVEVPLEEWDQLKRGRFAYDHAPGEVYLIDETGKLTFLNKKSMRHFAIRKVTAFKRIFSISMMG